MTRKRIRLITRVVTLLFAVLFAAQVLPRVLGMPPGAGTVEDPGASFLHRILVSDCAVILPAMSPFLGICSAIANRAVPLLFLACLPVVLLSLFGGRTFCLYMCPTGFVAELAGKARGKQRPGIKSIPHIGPLLIMFALAGALVGYPVFLWLDPLSIFNGFVSVWRKPIAAASLVPAIGFLAIVLSSIWRPNLWCYRLCPLGFSQEMLRSLGVLARERRTERAFAVRYWEGRRLALASLIGIAASFITRKLSMSSYVIRPPGTCDDDRLGALCARCGNCVRACPERIIRHDLGESGLERLLTPAITIGPKAYCHENCNECNRVCPTGAIGRMSLAEKRTVAIGLAKIIRSRCLAWAHGMPCFVCTRFCPYRAIRMVNQGHVACPEVQPDICRGCGLCQLVCPARQLAIIVEPRDQHRLKPVEVVPIPRGVVTEQLEALSRMRKKRI